MPSLLNHKLPISLLLSNGGILIGLLIAAVNFYNQFERNTQAIDRLTSEMAGIEERITSANLDDVNDQFQYLADRVNQEATRLDDRVNIEMADLTSRLDEVRRQASYDLETLKSESTYVGERLATLEQRAAQQDEDISEQGWSGGDLQRTLSQLSAAVQVINSRIGAVDEIQRESGYLKERLAALEVLVNQPAASPQLVWIEQELLNLVRRVDDLVVVRDQVDELYALTQELDIRAQDINERLSLLERVGNHAKLLEKARR